MHCEGLVDVLPLLYQGDWHFTSDLKGGHHRCVGESVRPVCTSTKHAVKLSSIPYYVAPVVSSGLLSAGAFLWPPISHAVRHAVVQVLPHLPNMPSCGGS